MPSPAPAAANAAMTPMAPMTFSLGNSSRMSPKDSGKTPPPTPWMTRATIITESEVATAAKSDPTVSATSVITSNRSLPYMSPSRPTIGVKIAADNRYAVSTQVTEFCDVCRPFWMVGSTGMTRDCSSA